MKKGKKKRANVSGYTSYTEALNAERSLFNAGLSFGRTRRDLSYALANFYKAMGDSWISEADRLIGVKMSRFDR
jgi:multidrug efflux system outer membrane protein